MLGLSMAGKTLLESGCPGSRKRIFTRISLRQSCAFLRKILERPSGSWLGTQWLVSSLSSQTLRPEKILFL